MLNWLIGNWDVFGFDGQNWMWVGGLALLVYVAWLLVASRPAGTR